VAVAKVIEITAGVSGNRVDLKVSFVPN
jgi:hypothetical protein